MAEVALGAASASSAWAKPIREAEETRAVKAVLKRIIEEFKHGSFTEKRTKPVGEKERERNTEVTRKEGKWRLII